MECTSSSESEHVRFENFLNEKPKPIQKIVFLSPRRIERRKQLSTVIMQIAEGKIDTAKSFNDIKDVLHRS